MSQFLSLGIKQNVQVVMVRWTVLIGAAYLVLYGSETNLSLTQELIFLGALLANIGLYASAVRFGAWEQLRWVITVADIALITIAAAISGGATNDFFLFFFLVLMIAGISDRFILTLSATAAMCAIYFGVMYLQHGADIFRQTEILIRLPFLLGVGLFFGAVSAEARREQVRFHSLSDANQKMAHRYHQVASERDRTMALLEVGQLALSSTGPEEVLQSITRLIQRTVRVDRCSLLVFNEGDRHAYLAACSEPSNEDVVLLLPLRHYPELQETLSTGEITELHPDDGSPLWRKVKHYLPKTTPFRSWLVVPIMNNHSVAGAFFLRDTREDFEFHEDERVFCKAAALMTAGFLQGCDLVEEMRRRSRLDGLTGLLNYVSFRQELESAIAQQRQQDNPKPLSLVMVDIDKLKVINDLHGHIAGDAAIQHVGKQLLKALPMARGICRYGGDEFFALVPMNKQQAVERVERVIIGLEQIGSSELPIPVTVSIGLATTPDDGMQVDQLVDAADRAMYLAKGEGGNRICLADPSNPEGRVFEAVISVNARRLVPGEQSAFRKVMDELLRNEEQELDSTAVKQSLTALMQAVESKDRYTNSHSHEVSDLTARLCEAIGLSEHETLTVEMGALVHDIGKIGIPDEILQKPGKLTTRERMEIEKHPQIGADILKPLPALEAVVPLVLHHHERWDGTGYPHGIKGEDIPIGSQIISLCDVWHALTSDRSYRPAFPEAKARAIVLDGRGKEWRPDLVDVFFGILDELAEQERAKHGPRRLRLEQRRKSA